MQLLSISTPSIRRTSITLLRIFVLGMLLTGLPLSAADPVPKNDRDPHYNEIGFFDIHVCNWPDRSLFFMPLFSTPRFAETEKIEVFYPDGSLLSELDLRNFRKITPKNKPPKRVFMIETDVPPGAPDGWYSARISMKDGNQYLARDYVILDSLPHASGHVPAPDQEVDEVPKELAWDPIPGAGFYQVFIRDLWNDSKLIHGSKLLSESRLALPQGLLEKGGYYSWVIHARDTNEHVLLGDFNHGSLSQPVNFSISD